MPLKCFEAIIITRVYIHRLHYFCATHIHIHIVIGNPSQLPIPKTPSLSDLQGELYHSASDKWEDIGIQLGIDDRKLTQIKSSYSNDTKSCLREMLRLWIARVDPPPSWSAMIDALMTLGDEELASKLKCRYCM